MSHDADPDASEPLRRIRLAEDSGQQGLSPGRAALPFELPEREYPSTGTTRQDGGGEIPARVVPALRAGKTLRLNLPRSAEVRPPKNTSPNSATDPQGRRLACARPGGARITFPTPVLEGVTTP